MKKILLSACVVLAALNTIAQTKPAAKPAAAATSFKSNLDSASYGFGISMSQGMKASGLEGLNYDLLVKGLKDGFTGSAPSLTEPQVQEVIQKLFKEVTQKKYASAIKAGKDFLENNKKQPGVQTTASGLQYLVLTAGNGPKPTEADTVVAHYKGTLLDGRQFDSSYDRNEPLEIPVNRVIDGWTEGLTLMPVGSKYRFFIPYNLAYGESGQGEDIPPYSTLIFEVELLKIGAK